VTSRDGAVIHDFMTNLARCGYRIELVHSRVEGQLATAELLASIRTFRTRPIDVLVVIRGGGSLESLLPFNNEALVREIASFPVPVIAGIGHDKDVPLMALAADVMVSTPTAVTALLNESWNSARHALSLSENRLHAQFRNALSQTRAEVIALGRDIRDGFQSVFTAFTEMERAVSAGMGSIRTAIVQARKDAHRYALEMLRLFKTSIATHKQEVQLYEATISAHDPMRQLKLGYSIVRSGGTVVRSVKDVKIGSDLDIYLADGTVETKVSTISKE
jgi:exodeoxyribonuclease VII large subunit